MIDVVQAIEEFNAGRDPERLALKYRNMRRDAFGFLRGSAHLFHARMPGKRVLAKAPVAWACGDLHLENFGSYKGDNRLVYFDINDFDDAALAPASWDVVRLLASVLVGAPFMHVGRAQAHKLCATLTTAYAQALADGKPRWVERDTAEGPVRQLLDPLRNRNRPDFLDQRTLRKGRLRRLRVDGKKALPASEAQRARAEALLARCAPRPGVPRFFEVLDVARRIAGTGSLGVERYVILIEGKGSPHGNYLLDLKEARPSAMAQCVRVTQPDWPAQAARVVAAQQRMQAVPMAFLHTLTQGRRSYVLRALQPSEDRIDLGGQAWSGDALDSLMRSLGQITAWAQLRGSGRDGSAPADALIEYAQRQKRQRELLEIAEECALRVEQDRQLFNTAFDAGVLNAGVQAGAAP